MSVVDFFMSPEKDAVYIERYFAFVSIRTATCVTLLILAGLDKTIGSRLTQAGATANSHAEKQRADEGDL